MKVKIIFIFLSSLSLWQFAAQAQENKGTFPTSPKNGEWEIVYFYKVPTEEGQGARPLIVKKKVSRSEDTRKEVMTWTNGKITERWLYGDLMLYQVPFEGRDGIILDSAPGGGDLEAMDFPELEWVKTVSSTKQESKNGKKCWLYEKNPQQRAWVEVLTGFPVSMESDVEKIDYTLLSTDMQKLTLSKSFQERIRQARETEQKERNRVR